MYKDVGAIYILGERMKTKRRKKQKSIPNDESLKQLLIYNLFWSLMCAAVLEHVYDCMCMCGSLSSSDTNEGD